MMILSFDAAKVNFKSDSSLCSSFGLSIISLFIIPTSIAPKGPLKGISDVVTARDAPIIDNISGGKSCSTDNTKQDITTSFLKSSGNSGLRGLSIALPIKTAASAGLPSLFLNPPGIFPTE